jgi:hypothetical protein
MEDLLELSENACTRLARSVEDLEKQVPSVRFEGNKDHLMFLLRQHVAQDVDDWILNIYQFGSR